MFLFKQKADNPCHLFLSGRSPIYTLTTWKRTMLPGKSTFIYFPLNKGCPLPCYTCDVFVGVHIKSLKPTLQHKQKGPPDPTSYLRAARNRNFFGPRDSSRPAASRLGWSTHLGPGRPCSPAASRRGETRRKTRRKTPGTTHRTTVDRGCSSPIRSWTDVEYAMFRRPTQRFRGGPCIKSAGECVMKCGLNILLRSMDVHGLIFCLSSWKLAGKG